MGDPPTFQFFFIIRQPSFEISIPALPILRKNYRKILCTYDHVETPFCVMSRYQLGRDERQNLGTTWPQNWGSGDETRGMRPFLIWISLRSKRFRLVSEQRKTDEERDSRFWPREKWNKSQKMPFFARSLTLVLVLWFFAPKPHGNACYACLSLLAHLNTTFVSNSQLLLIYSIWIETTFRFFIKGLFTRREGHPCAKVV